MLLTLPGLQSLLLIVIAIKINGGIPFELESSNGTAINQNYNKKALIICDSDIILVL